MKTLPTNVIIEEIFQYYLFFRSHISREGILEEFLRKNRSEVIAISIFEYNKEEEERKIRKAEYEAGKKIGFTEGESHGANRILQLIHLLSQNGRYNEIQKITTDKDLLNSLLKEYNL